MADGETMRPRKENDFGVEESGGDAQDATTGVGVVVAHDKPHSGRAEAEREDSSSSEEGEEESAGTSSKSEGLDSSKISSKKSNAASTGRHPEKGDDSSSSSSETEDDISKDVDKDEQELTHDELQLSKRQTITIDEEVTRQAAAEHDLQDEKSQHGRESFSRPTVVVEEVMSSSRKTSSSSASSSEVENELSEEQSVQSPKANGGTEIKRPQFRHSNSSLSDEEEEIIQISAATPSPTVPGDANQRNIEERKQLLAAAASSPPPNDCPASSHSPVPTRAGAEKLAKIYTDVVENNNVANKQEYQRSKPQRDITQIYTQSIAKASTPPASPKPTPSKNKGDITQLYTGGMNKSTNGGGPSPCIAADKLNPMKHNMTTAIDKDAIRQAYEEVRSDSSDTQWAVFKFEGNNLRVTATGKDFTVFKSSFSNDDRGFGYIRISTGDEMSKRAKFVFVTWVGPDISVMKKAKMSTDKALLKDIIQNLSVEIQLENLTEFSHDFFKNQVDRAAGARYGTGERAL